MNHRGTDIRAHFWDRKDRDIFVKALTEKGAPDKATQAALISELVGACEEVQRKWSASGALILECPEDKAIMRKFRATLTKAKEQMK